MMIDFYEEVMMVKVTIQPKKWMSMKMFYHDLDTMMVSST